MQAGELFTRAAYLAPLVETGCAAQDAGWQPLGSAADPVYLKAHSYGEFVFDFAFANAYRQSGLEYYPKILCAVPFTPVTGPRLAAPGRAAELKARVREYDASGAHVLFLPENELEPARQDGWLWRQDLRFVWRDHGYGDFDGFLAALASKKRKNIRAERRKVDTLGLDIRWQPAADIPAEDWPALFELYASTYWMRGQQPYLNLDCLLAWRDRLADEFLCCIARHAGEAMAMAFFFSDGERLYGRHWGSRIEADALHFELCYYRGIEYCLAHGLREFDAGVQGGHRLLRGFEPVLSHSLHWFADARFQRAIGDYLDRERAEVRRHCAALEQRTAYRHQP